MSMLSPAKRRRFAVVRQRSAVGLAISSCLSAIAQVYYPRVDRRLRGEHIVDEVDRPARTFDETRRRALGSAREVFSWTRFAK